MSLCKFLKISQAAKMPVAQSIKCNALKFIEFFND